MYCNADIWVPCQERSSSKRKEMWKTIQAKAQVAHPVQLILDMKVWWSSTYLMLDWAERNQKAWNTSVFARFTANKIAHSILKVLLMNYTMRSRIPWNVTNYTSWSSLLRNGSKSTCFLAFLVCVPSLLNAVLSDTHPACWQCTTSFLLQSSFHLPPCNPHPWSLTQGMDSSSWPSKIWALHCCFECRMYENWWLLWKDYGFLCLHHGNAYFKMFFVLFVFN